MVTGTPTVIGIGGSTGIDIMATTGGDNQPFSPVASEELQRGGRWKEVCMPMTHHTNRLLLGVPLAALLIAGVGGCAHQRFHHDLAGMHEDFHSRPHSRAEHRRFHEDLEDYHDDTHDRGYFDGRRYGRDSYDRRGYY
jgi:hypothetical protein